MNLSRRQWIATGALAGVAAAVSPLQAQSPVPGRVTEEQLGQLIETLGLKPDKKEQRYDFAFIAPLEDQQWELSMSAVLSQDQETVWIMAWLDELPKSSAEVPRTALLRLLAENDRIGGGKFFAYVPANRRFVLQRVIPNENLTSAKLRVELQDLGSSVIGSYGVWSVASWNPAGAPPAPTGGTATAPASNEVRSAVNDPKFEQPVRR
ncbi:MAG: type III secretion system chaperone [Planctomycetaceae bacterium]|nr:type III secretion system chaperone [Planctomycetaceae bacterium]